MKLNVKPLEPEKVYHIYNRGINGDNLFIKQKDAELFLSKYFEYTKDILETYCYCLLKNHFHFLVKIKSENEIRQVFHYKQKEDISKIISRQFAHFFNSYARIFQNKYDRVGGLFETPFRRIWVDSDSYFTEMVFYIHNNPQKHGFVTDFRDYKYSSYNIYDNALPDLEVNTSIVLDWFGGLELFRNYHQEKTIEIQNKYIFEVE